MKTRTTVGKTRKARISRALAKPKAEAETSGRKVPGRPSTVEAAAGNAEITQANSSFRVSKKATIEALVRREGGAAIADLMLATGWQAHSVRAALTGLRKAGHSISRDRDDIGGSRYRIAEAA